MGRFRLMRKRATAAAARRALPLARTTSVKARASLTKGSGRDEAMRVTRRNGSRPDRRCREFFPSVHLDCAGHITDSGICIAAMSATAPLLHLSSASTAAPLLRAIHRLRLVTSHFAPLQAAGASVPRSALGSRTFATSTSRRSEHQFAFTTACSFRGKPGSPVYTPPGTNPGPTTASTSADEKAKVKGRGGGLGRLKQGLDADHPLAKWRDAQLEKSPNGAGHDWFFIEGIPNKGGSAETAVESEGEGDKVKVAGIKGVVLGVAGTHPEQSCPPVSIVLTLLRSRS